jgi:predicted transcriptional regulator
LIRRFLHSSNYRCPKLSLSPIKQEILETMLLNDKPMKALDIAKEAKKDYQPVNMHLLGLIKMGYVSLPEKSLFIITEKGRRFLGIPEITKEKAAAILAYAPHDKAFNFYVTVGKPLSLHAHSLRDFANKLDRADVVSVEFHLKRGDFEAWFKGIGDEELAKKTALLKKRVLASEDLRIQLRGIVEQRYQGLTKLSGQPIPTEAEQTHEHTHS